MKPNSINDETDDRRSSHANGEVNQSRSADAVLNQLQTDVLLQFQDLTAIDDLERCKSLLEASDWNIEEAFRKFSSEHHSEPSEHHSELSEHHSERSEPATTQTSPSTQVSLLSNFFNLFTWPISIVYGTVINILRYAWSLIRPNPRHHLLDPLADVTNFKNFYEQKYGTSHPVFYLGSYSQALSDAKKELKFLLVYLHGDQHQDTDEFCTNVLSHSEVVRYINRNNILFWACSVNYAEGYKLSQALRENTYPFLGLVVLQNNRMTLVQRFEGKLSVEALLSRLQRAIETNESSLISARLEQQERNMTHIIRQQQDEAYQESLQADREKERKRLEEKKRKEEAEKAEADKRAKEVNRIEALMTLRKEIRHKLPAEPDISDENSVKILIKLPSGTRLERRFRKDEPIQYLYDFVFCQDASPLHFQMTTNFPRRELPGQAPTVDEQSESQSSRSTATFDSFGLGKSEMLFVHDLEA